MVRTYLRFFAIFSGLVLLIAVGYWVMNRDTKEARIFVPETQKQTVSVPGQKADPITPPPESITTSPAETKPAVTDDENMPKPTNTGRMKFESEDEVDNTDDSITIEVEPEEE
jgi:hypothetical protein